MIRIRSQECGIVGACRVPMLRRKAVIRQEKVSAQAVGELLRKVFVQGGRMHRSAISRSMDLADSIIHDGDGDIPRSGVDADSSLTEFAQEARRLALVQ
jgi:hypothetical protein